MKILNIFFVLSLIVIISPGCKKKKKDDPATAHTLTLQPGPGEGQDTHVAKIDNQPLDGNTNLNFTNELVMAKWTTGGNAATWRSFIKFTGLSAIPTDADVTSAKLYLYGPAASISFPSGNSGTNSAYIQRVVGANWDQATLNFNNMPASTDIGQAIIPQSNSTWGYHTVVDVTTMVKEMVANPTTNYGFSIRLVTETPSKALIFATSEVSTPDLRPKLVVESTY